MTPSDLDRELAIDAICVRFEEALRSGSKPTIEGYLASAPTGLKSRLARELILLETEYRRRSGAAAALDDYQRRFPDLGVDKLAPELAAITSPNALRDVGAPPVGLPVLEGYQLLRLLGRGAAGRVYEGFDLRLRRRVAVKVFHGVSGDSASTESLRQLDRHLDEARSVARLDHPNIVPVYDVGRAHSGEPFVVSKLIEGGDLARCLRTERLDVERAVRITIGVADALDHAHHQGLVHRDVKPANILLDGEGQPYLSDFGLALRDEELGHGARFVGTPAYMSPEQARGEGHRVDARSDVFGLGSVLYEMLTGHQPFTGSTRSELLEAIGNAQVVPPRQHVSLLAEELERISLRALARRASDRYASAAAFAHDLRDYLSSVPTSRRSPRPTVGTGVAVVPRGLRAFDASDADFFLELLPPPRDRDGLARIVRHWKNRIETAEPSRDHALGVIYGPSGCGKSSIVKAGLLPRLGPHVTPVYVECSARDTEMRLRHRLVARVPEIADESELRACLAAARRRDPAAPRLLLVLDQFEQWLHAWNGDREAELVRALRQCDGDRVQCLLVLRDDFWLAISRLAAELEVTLVEGESSTLVDLFERDHAQQVLTLFGRSFGALPEGSKPLSRDQQEFVTEAIDEITVDASRVVCVRLALFAEMMKGRRWTRDSLRAVGGTDGIGVSFLEDAIDAPSAPADQRMHQTALRRMLRSLLPEAATVLRGRRRSYDELRRASGYEDQPAEFDAALNILDGRLRLITPVDPERTDAPVGRAVPRSYQLTHDYLVTAIRRWLHRHQQGTRAGRAALRLAERTALWQTNQEPRLLPSLLEWGTIRALTEPVDWSASERRCMLAAGRRHRRRLGIQGVLLAIVLSTLLFVVKHFEEQRRVREAEGIVSRLLVTEPRHVAEIVAELERHRLRADPMLRDLLERGEGSERGRLFARLALLPVDVDQAEPVSAMLLDISLDALPLVIDQLTPVQSVAMERVVQVLRDDETPERRLRAACALAHWDPSTFALELMAPRVANGVVDAFLVTVAMNAAYYSMLVDELRTGGESLLDALERAFCDVDRPELDRTHALQVFAEYAGPIPSRLVPALLATDASHIPLLIGRIHSQRDESVALLRAALVDPELTSGHARRRANAAIGLLLLGVVEPAVAGLRGEYGTETRSQLIDSMAAAGVVPATLIARLAETGDSHLRRSILLALGNYRRSAMPDLVRADLRESCRAQLEECIDAGERSAILWLASRLGIDVGDGSHGHQGKRCGVFSGPEGFVFAVVEAPVEFMLGSKSSEASHQSDEGPVLARIELPFALSICEVTLDQFHRFRPEFTHEEIQRSPSGDCPVLGVTWYEAAQYCNWLSEQAGIPVEEWCYTAASMPDAADAMMEEDDAPTRLGFRLPLEKEWEFACRAGTTTRRFFGDEDSLLDRYAWCNRNADEHAWPVASLRPNDLGLFDMLGNVMEWCHDRYRPYQPHVDDSDFGKYDRILRGGSFYNQARLLRSADRVRQVPGYRSESIGFRVARTLLSP